MAIEFVISFRRGAVELSIPGTDFHQTVETSSRIGAGDLPADVDLMKQLTAILHREIRWRMSVKYLANKLFDRFDYSIVSEIEIPEAGLVPLTEVLPVHLRMCRLTVNGRDLTIPLWRRNLEYWLRLFLVDVIPLVMLFFGFIFMPAPLWSNPLYFLAFLFVVLYLSRFLGKGLWMLATRRLVPRGYLLALLQARHKWLGLFDRFWMRVVWGPIGE